MVGAIPNSQYFAAAKEKEIAMPRIHLRNAVMSLAMLAAFTNVAGLQLGLAFDDTTLPKPDASISEATPTARQEQMVSHEERDALRSALIAFRRHLERPRTNSAIAKIDQLLKRAIEPAAFAHGRALKLPVCDYNRVAALHCLESQLGKDLCNEVQETLAKVVCDGTSDATHRLVALSLLAKCGMYDPDTMSELSAMLLKDAVVQTYCKNNAYHLPAIVSSIRLVAGGQDDRDIQEVRNALQRNMRSHGTAQCIEALACASQLREDDYDLAWLSQMESKDVRQQFISAIVCNEAGQKQLIQLIGKPEDMIGLDSAIKCLAARIQPGDELWLEFCRALQRIALEDRWNDEIRGLCANLAFASRNDEFESKYVKCATQSNSKTLLVPLLLWRPSEHVFVDHFALLVSLLQNKDAAVRQTGVAILTAASPEKPRGQSRALVNEAIEIAISDADSIVRRTALFLIGKSFVDKRGDATIYRFLCRMIKAEDSPEALVQILIVASAACDEELLLNWPNDGKGYPLLDEKGIKWANEHLPEIKKRAINALRERIDSES